MQTLLIALAVILLAIWIAGHLIGALFHLLAWLFALIPYVVLALLIAAGISWASSRNKGSQ